MDLIHDSSHRTWYHLGVKFASIIPQYVMDSELQTKEAADQLATREFADDGRRLFPIDSPAATWLSAAYFAKNASREYSPRMTQLIEKTIKEAADVYGIRKDVDAIMDAVRNPAPEKRAEDDASNFGWVSGEDRRYPMFDAAGVIKASSYFDENRSKYPLEMRQKIATAIVAKAAEYGIAVAGSVRREAGDGMPRRDTMMAELLERANLYKDAETSMLIANLNELVMTASADELHGALSKVAEVLDIMDRNEGLDRSYGKRLLSPADFLYDIDIKEAQAVMEDSVELGRNVFSLKKLAELPTSLYGNVLGEDFESRIKKADGGIDTHKLADELFSLPRPDKQALEDHLATLFS